MPATLFCTTKFGDRPGVDKLRFAHELIQIGQDARMVNELIEDTVQSRQTVEPNLVDTSWFRG